MFNLLSDKEKKAIKRDYFLRLLGIFFFLLTAIVFCSAALLVPSYFLAKQKENDLMEMTRNSEYTGQIKEESELAQLVRQTSDKISVLSGISATKISVLFKEITDAKPASIKILSLSFQKAAKAKDTSKIVLGGVAPDRDTLLAFKENLSKDQNFSGVDLPVSSFASSNDINFSVTLSGNF